jgi:hypothetical protein
MIPLPEYRDVFWATKGTVINNGFRLIIYLIASEVIGYSVVPGIAVEDLTSSEKQLETVTLQLKWKHQIDK